MASEASGGTRLGAEHECAATAEAASAKVPLGRTDDNQDTLKKIVVQR
jgi:hypothetical protein